MASGRYTRIEAEWDPRSTLGVVLAAKGYPDSYPTGDVITGLGKTFFFGGIIAMSGIYNGFATKGGAEGVGRKTTSSVVTSIVFIILVDLIFTALFYFY